MTDLAKHVRKCLRWDNDAPSEPQRWDGPGPNKLVSGGAGNAERLGGT